MVMLATRMEDLEKDILQLYGQGQHAMGFIGPREAAVDFSDVLGGTKSALDNDLTRLYYEEQPMPSPVRHERNQEMVSYLASRRMSYSVKTDRFNQSRDQRNGGVTIVSRSLLSGTVSSPAFLSHSSSANQTMNGFSSSRTPSKLNLSSASTTNKLTSTAEKLDPALLEVDGLIEDIDINVLLSMRKDGSLDWLIECAILLLTDVGKAYFDSMKAHLWQHCSRIKAVKTRIRRLVQMVQLAMMASEDGTLVDLNQTSNREAWEKAQTLMEQLPKQIEYLCKLDDIKHAIEGQLPDIVGEKLAIEDELEQATSWKKWELASQLKAKLDEMQTQANDIRKKLERVDSKLKVALALEEQVVAADHAIAEEIAALGRLLTGPSSSTCTKDDYDRMLTLEAEARTLRKLCDKLKRLSVVKLFTHPWATKGLTEHTLTDPAIEGYKHQSGTMDARGGLMSGTDSPSNDESKTHDMPLLSMIPDEQQPLKDVILGLSRTRGGKESLMESMGTVDLSRRGSTDYRQGEEYGFDFDGTAALEYNRREGDSSDDEEEYQFPMKPELPIAEAVAVGCDRLTLRWHMPGMPAFGEEPSKKKRDPSAAGAEGGGNGSSKNPSGVIEYEIEIGTKPHTNGGERRVSIGSSGFEFEPCATTCTSAVHLVAPTFVSLDGLCAGTEYVFQLRACNKTFWGAWSEPLVVTTGCDPRRHALARLERHLVTQVGEGGDGSGLENRFKHLCVDVVHRRIKLTTSVSFKDNADMPPIDDSSTENVVYELGVAVKMLHAAVAEAADEKGVRLVVRVEGHADSVLGGRDAKRLSVGRAAAMHALLVEELGGDESQASGGWRAAGGGGGGAGQGGVTSVVYQGLGNSRARRRGITAHHILEAGRGEAANGGDQSRYLHGNGCITIGVDLEDGHTAAAPFVQIESHSATDSTGEAMKWIGVYKRSARVEGGGIDGNSTNERTPVYRGPRGNWLWSMDCAPPPHLAPTVVAADSGGGDPSGEDWARTVALHGRRTWHLGHECDIGTDTCIIWSEEPAGGTASGVGLASGMKGVQAEWVEPVGWEPAVGVAITVPSKEEAKMNAQEPMVVQVHNMPEEHADCNGRYERVTPSHLHEGGTKDAKERALYRGGMHGNLYAFYERGTECWCIGDEHCIGFTSPSAIDFDGGCGVVRVASDAPSMNKIAASARWQVSKGWKAIHNLRLHMSPLQFHEGDEAAGIDPLDPLGDRSNDIFGASLWRQRQRMSETVVLQRRASTASTPARGLQTKKSPKANNKANKTGTGSMSGSPFDPTIVNLRGQALGRSRLPLSCRLKYFYSMFDPNKAKRTQAIMAEASQYLKHGAEQGAAEGAEGAVSAALMTPEAKKAAGKALALSKLNGRLREIYGCDLEHDPLPNAAPKLLAHSLALNLHVVALYLEKTGLDAAALAPLAETLGMHSTLRELYLNSNNIGDEGAKLLAKHMLTDLSNLKRLSGQLQRATWAKGGGEGKHGKGGASRGADSARPSLTWLHMSSCGIGAEGAAHLARALKTNCTLSTLMLGKNNIGTGGAVAFADAMRFNSALEYAGLDENNIGAQGATALARALGANTGLRTLNLVGNDLGGEAEEDIAVAELLSSIKFLR
jgi:hypothetical protein